MKAVLLLLPCFKSARAIRQYPYVRHCWLASRIGMVARDQCLDELRTRSAQGWSGRDSPLFLKRPRAYGEVLFYGTLTLGGELGIVYAICGG